MQVSSAGQDIVRDSGSWKTVGKMVAGGIAGAFIDGIGLSVVWTKEVGKSIGRDVLNLVTGKDVPKSLAKLVADTVGFPLGIAGFAVLGTICGLAGGAAITYEEGLGSGVEECVDIVKEQNKALKDINNERGFFIAVL